MLELHTALELALDPMPFVLAVGGNPVKPVATPLPGVSIPMNMAQRSLIAEMHVMQIVICRSASDRFSGPRRAIRYWPCNGSNRRCIFDPSGASHLVKDIRVEARCITCKRWPRTSKDC